MVRKSLDSDTPFNSSCFNFLASGIAWVIPRCFVLLSCFIVFFLSSCSSSNGKSRHHLASEGGSNKLPLEAPIEGERAPWELWSYGQDLDGVSIRVQEIRDGDEALKSGDYVSGLRSYKKVNEASLTQKDKEALVVRIASCQMGLSLYNQALETISRYYESLGSGAEAVGGQFALILGYGYGATGDFDQSLAWFGRADTTASNSPLYSNAAQRGAKLLISSISESKFDEVYSRWKDDQTLGTLFAREHTL